MRFCHFGDLLLFCSCCLFAARTFRTYLRQVTHNKPASSLPMVLCWHYTLFTSYYCVVLLLISQPSISEGKFQSCKSQHQMPSTLCHKDMVDVTSIKIYTLKNCEVNDWNSPKPFLEPSKLKIKNLFHDFDNLRKGMEN